jgi:four helix bundle protein
MSRGGFKSLLAWQKAQDLAVAIYELTRLPGWSRHFHLVDQMRRAAISVPSNIAEGDERDTDKDSVRFMYIAKGSLAELRSQLDLAARIGLLPEETFIETDQRCEEVARILRGLIKARSNS